MDEVARKIIREQMQSGGEALPWKDLKLFKELLLAHSIEIYLAAMENAQEVTFFDRDILELISYDRLTKTESSSQLIAAALTFIYNRKVFLVPPWEQIYCHDEERTQTYEEAVEVYQGILKVNLEYGRQVIELPKASVEERADFVIYCIHEGDGRC